MQGEDGDAISRLTTDQDYYLMGAYSHDPRDDKELKALLDLLNIQGEDRDKVMRNTR